MKVHKRHLVTAALPYANGPVHIGHLAGNFFASRYLRQIFTSKKRRCKIHLWK
jgi:methionyl-tRNA synthetase